MKPVSPIFHTIYFIQPIGDSHKPAGTRPECSNYCDGKNGSGRTAVSFRNPGIQYMAHGAGNDSIHNACQIFFCEWRIAEQCKEKHDKWKKRHHNEKHHMCCVNRKGVFTKFFHKPFYNILIMFQEISP